ncbi:PIN domain-containing protein [Candidatus Roizmanbacteria bacterium]|nr:PIN domain-containing protein [Candidatus Roizmanbacteria bacterium]
MRIFLDTNVFLRYFTKDDREMYDAVEELLLSATESKIHLATSTVVLTEIMYTLKSFYKQNNSRIQQHIDSILEITNLVLLDKTNFKQAYTLHKKRNVKISDCLIATQVPESYKLCSFDNDLEKIIGKNRFITPGKVLSQI